MLAVPAFGEEEADYSTVITVDNLVSREMVNYNGNYYLKHTVSGPTVLKIKDPRNLMYEAEVFLVDDPTSFDPSDYLRIDFEKVPLKWDDVTYTLSLYDENGNKIGTKEVKEAPGMEYAELYILSSAQITLKEPGTYVVTYSRWAMGGDLEIVEVLGAKGAAKEASESVIGLSNFTKQRTYSPGTFKDVNEKDWYAESVAACYELGLMEGKGDGKFDPLGNISLAEAITLAARVNKIYNGKGATIENTGPNWYDGAVSYAVAQGIISGGEFEEYARPATRAELAYIFARALPDSEYPAINNISELPDVDDETKYSQEIFKLYNAGIVTGSDQHLTFKPNDNISRAEVSAIITRVVQPANRKVLQ